METEDSIYFYGHTGKFDYMSNFYNDEFVDPKTNNLYCCSEQYFMYQKCLLFDPKNTQLLKKILESTNPYDIKSYGRKVGNYNEELWNEKRYKIMKKALLLKFQDPDLKKKLLSTKDKILYEASKYDKIWGIGMDATSAIKSDKNKFGQNLLGKCLMETRKKLKQ